MAAKLLHSLTDENPDLQKQIGCMTGVFQLFDRNHILAGRRINGHNPKRLPADISHFDGRTMDTESNNRDHRPPVMENHSNKNVREKQRASTELSRPSFSSSSRSSSFSSLDCNRTAPAEPSSSDRIIFPETPSLDPAMSQSSASPQFGRQALDLRDVVKDSMYREARGLSVKTSTKEKPAADHAMKQRDSPRPLQLPKTNDVAYSVGPSGKQNLPVDLKESLKVLDKLREAPWYCDGPRELSRSSSYNLRDGSFSSVPKDARRFSYDGKEIDRVSFESRDTSKPALKLKELPRLSLDSREGSMRSFSSESKYNFLSRDSHMDSGSAKDEAQSLQKGSQTRPPSLVAKLMGLDTLPDSISASGDSCRGSIRGSPLEDSETSSRSLKTTDLYRPIQISNSSKNSWKEPTSPRWKNPDPIMKPISRFPIEPAPWRQIDGALGSQKSVASRHLKAPAKPAANHFPSVYCEIEKRLKDIEFPQSGKDLRALKQILEAMQAKGLLDTRKEGQDSNFAAEMEHEQKQASTIQNGKFINQRTLANRGSSSSRASDSPIVIMKPAKLVEKSGIHASSVIPLDGLSRLPKLQGDSADQRKGSLTSRIAKDQIPKTSRRDNAINSNRNLKLVQTSTRPQQLPKENTTSSAKSSGAISPRLQQKKLELEKRSRPPTPPSDSSKPRRQSNKQQTESSSPGGRRRPKSSNVQQSEDQHSEISSETRNLSYQENHVSLQSDGSVYSESKADVEVTSSDRSGEINSSHSPSMQASEYSVLELVHKKSTLMLSEDESLVELSAIGPEYSSPVSVLDNPEYIDDAPSPVKQIPETLKDDCTKNSTGYFTKEQRDPADDHISNSTGSEINRKKLQNIEHLVQKLTRLNSGHDEARTDYIASLCDNTNPDHRYISEILLASGLLLRDLGSSLSTFQFHPSGHPINPELFLVLEQTKASTLPLSTEKVAQLKPEKEKFRRKLIFDAVNEILVGKLAALMEHSSEPWLRPAKLTRTTLNAQKLLRELCLEIDQFRAKKPECCSLEDDDDDDGLKSILWEDVMRREESWTDFHGEISSVVLDVERSIFKDLVDEIVIGGAAGLRVKPGRRRRQLFVKY